MKTLCAVLLLLFAISLFRCGLNGKLGGSRPLAGRDLPHYLSESPSRGLPDKRTIRVTQFCYKIVESTGGPDGFTLTGSMMDGPVSGA